MIKTIRPVTMLAVFIGSVSVFAEGPRSVDEAQVQQMMQGMAEMAACYQNIDQDKLQAFGQRAQAMEKELKVLCADGQRAEAQAKAMAFGLEVVRSEEMAQMRACGKMAQQMMPKIPDYSVYKNNDDEDDKDIRHVCDEI